MSDVESIAEDIVPGVAQWKAAKVIAVAVAGLLILALASFMIWRSFFANGAAQAKHDITAAKVQAGVGKAEGDAGANAANVVAGGAQREEKTHEITRDHYVEITKQPGAGDPVSGPVWNAFVRSVCMRPSATGLPDCQRLQEANPK